MPQNQFKGLQWWEERRFLQTEGTSCTTWLLMYHLSMCSTVSGSSGYKTAKHMTEPHAGSKSPAAGYLYTEHYIDSHLLIWQMQRFLDHLYAAMQRIPSNFTKCSKNVHNFAKVSHQNILESFTQSKIHPLQTCMLGYQTHDIYLLYHWATKTQLQVKARLVLRIKVYIYCMLIFLQLVSKAQMSATKDICTGQTSGIIKIFSWFVLVFSAHQGSIFISSQIQ